MPIDSVLDAARAGMNYERLRLDAASRNIAAANVTLAPGQQATLRRVESGGGFDAWLQGATPAAGEQPAAVREVRDPGHPMADANGIVRYPATDMVQEMTEMMTASRGYEANVRSFNLLRGMMLRAMEIGAK